MRELFFALVHEAMPGVELHDPDAWATAMQRLLDAGKTAAEMQSVMQWAVCNAFWKSRILSPEAFLDNFPKMLLQIPQEYSVPGQDDDGEITNGCSDAEWERRKLEKKGDGQKGKIEPP